ncbi:hypothetical protein BN168_350029 [Clostridioides difficile CD002]|nr:hypothetical protein BN167_830005 [Clostridioides difficile E13]CCL06150.1 hypothetical protein BN168_350029 [Clostridioides difficile CD002]
MLILPLATGLLHFLGCFLSLSMSIESFSAYTDDDIRQKHTNAINVFKNKFIFSMLFEKIIAENTKKFFIYCFILINFI